MKYEGNHMIDIDQIIRYEQGEMDEQEMIEMLQGKK